MKNIGGPSGIGAPLAPNRIGGDTWIRRIGDRLVFDIHEGAGATIRDLSGNDNNGILGTGTNAPTWKRNCLSFDGVDDYVNCGHKSSIGNIFDGGGIIESSIEIVDSSIGLWDWFNVAYKGPPGWDLYVGGQLNGKCELAFDLYFSVESLWSGTANKEIIVDSLECFVVAYKTGEVYPVTYIGGRKVSQWTVVTIPEGTRISDVANDLYIGNTETLASPFKGLISFVRINTTILSAIQALQEYLYHKWRN